MRVFVLILTSFLVASCSDGKIDEVSHENLYIDMYEAANQSPLSEFQKAVLGDNEISKTEYDEAHQRFLSCVEEKGGSVELEEVYGRYTYTIHSDIDDYDQRIFPECEPGTVAHIAGIYNAQLSNPERKPIEEVIIECLLENNVVSDPFTINDFEYVQNSSSSVSKNNDIAVSEDGSIDPMIEEITENPDYISCLSNPSFHKLD